MQTIIKKQKHLKKVELLSQTLGELCVMPAMAFSGLLVMLVAVCQKGMGSEPHGPIKVVIGRVLILTLSFISSLVILLFSVLGWFCTAPLTAYINWRSPGFVMSNKERLGLLKQILIRGLKPLSNE